MASDSGDVTDDNGRELDDDMTEVGDACAATSATESDDGVDSVEPAGDLDAAFAQLEAQRDGYLASLQQTQADFENYKKRAQRLAADELDRSVGQLVERLLPVLDNVELGVSHGVEGLAPIGRALLDELVRAGLEPIEALDAAFDPHEHEAVGEAPGSGEGEPGSVAQVLRAGYRWRGKVLRPAMVMVRGS